MQILQMYCSKKVTLKDSGLMPTNLSEDDVLILADHPLAMEELEENELGYRNYLVVVEVENVMEFDSMEDYLDLMTYVGNQVVFNDVVESMQTIGTDVFRLTTEDGTEAFVMNPHLHVRTIVEVGPTAVLH